VRRFIMLATVVVPLSGAYGGDAPVDARTSPAKPNFVFILADDMRYFDLKYMPKTNSLLGEQGIHPAEESQTLSRSRGSLREALLRHPYEHRQIR
jgi:hypothetical protein